MNGNQDFYCLGKQVTCAWSEGLSAGLHTKYVTMEQRSKNMTSEILDPEILHGERVQVEKLKCYLLTSFLGGDERIKGMEESCNEEIHITSFNHGFSSLV